MEFWGVEVKGDKPIEVQPDLGQFVRLSQATLGEIKKGGGNVTLFVKIGDQKLVLGRLNPENFPHLSFDLVFERTFELSHDWKDGTVHLCGFRGDLEEEEDDFPGFGSSDEEDEELELKNENTLKSLKKKLAAAKSKDADDDDDDEDDEDDSSDEEDESDDEEILAANGAKFEEDENSDEDTADEDSDEDDEEPAKPAESGKKRPVPAAKTPEAKKSKVATPKASACCSLPCGKNGPKGDKSKAQTPKSAGQGTPKSAGQGTPKSAGKKLNNGSAKQSHKKAKQSAGK